MITDTGPKEIDSAPVIIGERAYLPVRSLAESFGAKVDYNNGQITVIDGLATARINVDSSTIEMVFDGGFAEPYTIELSTPPVIDDNNRCLLPMRNIAEDILGCEVQWNEDKSIIISRAYQTKRLIVKADSSGYSFVGLPLAECFSNNSNLYILQFSLQIPDVYVRRCCMELRKCGGIISVEPDKVMKVDF